jgi:hypothetical protein
MTKRIFRNNYLEIEFYWKGIMLGIITHDDILTIIIPFFTFEFHLYMFKSLRGTKS